MADFKCPRCGSSNQVVRTNKSPVGVERQRRCENGHLFNTTEKADGADFRVRRRNGVSEPFNLRILVRSLRLAAPGDELPEQQRQDILDDVVESSGMPSGKEVSTEELGKLMITQLLKTRPISGLRYATTFLSTRGIVKDVASLKAWILERLPTIRPSTESMERPFEVVKKSGKAESFELEKIWQGVEISTKGLIPTSAVSDSASWSTPDFVGAIVAVVLDDLRGQPLVTSGQVSASVMRVLRGVCPLGYLRFATKAKAYGRPLAYVDEASGILSHPTKPAPLEVWVEEGRNLAAEIESAHQAAAR